MGGSDDLFSPRGLENRAALRDRLAAAAAADPPRPVLLEVGFGDGRLLGDLARARPDVAVLGVEYQGAWVRKAAARLRREGPGNAFVLKGDARVLLTLDVPPAALDHVLILFPDPWWKASHSRRRRLFTPELLDLLARAMKPGGVLLLRTDVRPYLDSSAAYAAAHPAFAAARDDDPALRAPPWAGLQTRRERKCAEAGIPTWERAWTRRTP